ncbi:MAG: hypothetical protein ABF539_08215 [Liquorilactobacillus nagelii]|jgi:ABC-type dipeptide/oligopeptide/nickel transport system permease subunit|uniref:hypothetical protein n=1 Tax=Liquorilactobacillus nagelii TaxID=82688 RepID=UPI0039E9665A
MEKDEVDDLKVIGKEAAKKLDIVSALPFLIYLTGLIALIILYSESGLWGKFIFGSMIIIIIFFSCIYTFHIYGEIHSYKNKH